ncbi:MAG TPA: methionyl-tRNA formyltransferase [Longimicrobiales bacterium]
MRILFWGTPDFAVPSLSALLGEAHEVVAVVTQPDRPAGRGRELRAPPVKIAARDEGIAVLQPERARDPSFVAQIRELAPEISVVIAYGQILSREVLYIPQHGSINAHASLLPELRGAAPINWAIVRGMSVTGVTVMRMVEKMDAGPMLYQVKEPIGAEESASDLWSRLSEISAEALVETLALIEGGALTEEPQDEARATYAPRIHRDDARVDFTRDAVSVSNHIRGMDASPGAWTLCNGEELKLFRPRPAPAHVHHTEPGRVLAASPVNPEEGLLIACGSGAVSVREVQVPGKRRMPAADWLRGRGVVLGDQLGA